jgi:hypothetical protein
MVGVGVRVLVAVAVALAVVTTLLTPRFAPLKKKITAMIAMTMPLPIYMIVRRVRGCRRDRRPMI